MIFANWAATSPLKREGGAAAADERHLVRSVAALGDPTDRLRRQVAAQFGFAFPERVIFGSGVTDLLNKMILGLLDGDGGHVVTTVLEHNSVLRPLHYLTLRRGLAVTHCPIEADGCVAPQRIAAALRPDTRLCILSHVSNVSGAIQPVAEVAAVCRDRGVPVLLDCAQSGGWLACDFATLGADAAVFSAHKALMGPSGLGFALLGPDCDPVPVITGGSGIMSELEGQPPELPWRLEAGTPNYEALPRLEAALAALDLSATVPVRQAFADFVAELHRIDGVRLVGVPTAEYLPIVNLIVEGFADDSLAFVLLKAFDIVTRHGLHCAPLMHRHLGTYDTGTTRISFGPASTAEDMAAVLAAVRQIAAQGKRG